MLAIGENIGEEYENGQYGIIPNIFKYEFFENPIKQPMSVFNVYEPHKPGTGAHNQLFGLCAGRWNQ